MIIILIKIHLGAPGGLSGLFLLVVGGSLWKNTSPEGSVVSQHRYQPSSQDRRQKAFSLQQCPGPGPQAASHLGCALGGSSLKREGKSLLSYDKLCPELGCFSGVFPISSGAGVNFLRAGSSSLSQSNNLTGGGDPHLQ